VIGIAWKGSFSRLRSSPITPKLTVLVPKNCYCVNLIATSPKLHIKMIQGE